LADWLTGKLADLLTDLLRSLTKFNAKQLINGKLMAGIFSETGVAVRVAVYYIFLLFFYILIYDGYIKILSKEVKNMGSTANVYQKLADRMSLSANEVCGMTGIGRNTVYNALASGQLRGKRIGKKKWVILVSEVNRWLSES